MTSHPDTTFELRPEGEFSLAEASGFGFGPRQAATFDGVFRLAFPLDVTWQAVGVEVRQEGGTVHGRVWGSTDAAAVARQVARILSLDHDGRAYDALGDLDPVVGELQREVPGLRPVLFHSPYEAAAWSVLSARRPRLQMAAVRNGLSATIGTTFELGGQTLAAFPSPAALAGIDRVPGLDATKVERLRGVARAALDGRLDVDHLTTLGPERAGTELRQLAGIGPFYANLIVLRACGWADVLATDEPRLQEAVRRVYDLDGPLDPGAFAAIAEPWRPFRTWVCVLIRAVTSRRVAASA